MSTFSAIPPSMRPMIASTLDFGYLFLPIALWPTTGLPKSAGQVVSTMLEASARTLLHDVPEAIEDAVTHGLMAEVDASVRQLLPISRGNGPQRGRAHLPLRAHSGSSCDDMHKDHGTGDSEYSDTASHFLPRIAAATRFPMRVTPSLRPRLPAEATDPPCGAY